MPELDVDHDEIGILTGAQRVQRVVDAGGLRDLGAAVHRDLGRRRDMAFEISDDQ
jgi:hypothetical protein